MKIYIYKYRRKNVSDNFSYFNKQNFVDFIKIERFLFNNLPQFTEEYTDQEDFTIFKAGYYSVTLSMIEGTLSRNGKNIDDFINDYSEFKYLSIIELKSGRTFSGIIDDETIETYRTIADNSFFIKYNVVGIEKEAIEYIKTKDIAPMPGVIGSKMELSYYFNQHLNDSLQSDILKCNCDISFMDTYGTNVYVSADIHYHIIEQNKGSMPIWNILKGFIEILGLRWKAEVTEINNEYPIFSIIIYNRITGLNSVIVKEKTIIEGRILNSYTHVLIPSCRLANPITFEGQELYYYYGLLISGNGNTYINDVCTSGVNGPSFAWKHNINQFWYFSQIGELQKFGEDSFFKLEHELWSSPFTDPHNGSDTYIPIGRCLFTNWGGKWNFYNSELLEKISRTNWQYLLKNIRKTIKSDIKFTEKSMLKVGSIITRDDGKDYICDRISEINLATETAKTEWTEV